MKKFVQRVDVELKSMAEQQKAVIRKEVQTEISGLAVIEDHAGGRAPTEHGHCPSQPAAWRRHKTTRRQIREDSGLFPSARRR